MSRRGRSCRYAAAVLVLAAAAIVGVGASAAGKPIMRLELHLQTDARTRPRPLLLTLGGPIYCMQLLALARTLDSSLACPDYGPNRDVGPGERAGRREDWGDPAYDAAVAGLPGRLREEGVEISKLVVVGVSYSGYADAELVATHPELHPAALIVVDSYFDLAARYEALPAYHETKAEMEAVLGGALAANPVAYAARSPSHHLAGLARAIHAGMRLVVVWSTAPGEEREFRGATCSRLADAQWMADLAALLGRPVTGYVTQLQHAHALWNNGSRLLSLAGLDDNAPPVLGRPVTFRPNRPPPAGSYCS